MGLFRKKKSQKDLGEEDPTMTEDTADPQILPKPAPSATTTEKTEPSSSTSSNNEPTTLDRPHDEEENDDHHHHDDGVESDEEHEDGELEGRKEWDEGGPSDCGYTESVHGVLMSVGESVHSLVGEPPKPVHQVMDVVGNWFQEASYAVRDFSRGEDQEGMKEDTQLTMKELFAGGKKEQEDEEEEEAVVEESNQESNAQA